MKTKDLLICGVRFPLYKKKKSLDNPLKLVDSIILTRLVVEWCIGCCM